jgi:hypothetical protein
VVEEFLSRRVMARLGQVPRQRGAPPAPDAAIAAFAVGAGVSLLAWWVNSGFDLPRETIAEQMTLLIAYGASAAAGIDTTPARPRVSRARTT